MAGEYVELPEELIQHIQSFLDPRAAVRTSVLSKLWYSAWSTRPILCLDYRNYGGTDFENLAWTSINRYRKLNVKLNTFKLSTMYYWIRHDESIRLFVDKLILSALTLGVNDLHLGFCEYCKYTLPDQVFSSIYLKKLCIKGCIINLPQSNGKFRVLCSRLVSLELFRVCVTDDMMRDILLGCPLMEDLRVDRCYDLKKINLSAVHCNLRSFQADSLSWQKLLVVEWDEVNMQQQFHKLISLKLICVEVNDLFCMFFSLRFPCLERLELRSCTWPVTNTDMASNSLKYLSFNSIYGLRFAKYQVPNVLHQYHNLISLELYNVEVDDLFFKFFSHRFPCLERLELLSCRGRVINIDIASNSLRYLTLRWIEGLRFIKVQAPNIHNFRLVTSKDEGIPTVSFPWIPGEWKSDLSFYQPDVIDDSWLLRIKDILTELSQSKISLSIYMSRNYLVGSTSISGEIIQSNLIPRILPFVENLEIQTRGRLNLFDWLFFCQPKYITCIDLSSMKESYDILELAYNVLKKHENKNLSDALPCIHGLEEVDMEYYEEILREWLPVRQRDEEAADEGGEFRLRLKWTPE